MSATKGTKPWNAGKGNGWVSPRGYRVVSVTENGKRKQVPEHRYLMEKHLGRRLRPDEIIHHINGVPTDNRIENMQITTFSIHTALHHNGSKRLGRSKRHMEVIANYREENKRLNDLNYELLAACKTASYNIGISPKAAIEYLRAAIARAEGRAD